MPGDRVIAADLHQAQFFLESARTVREFAFGIHHKRIAVEHQFVLAADEIGIKNRDMIAPGRLHDNLEALLTLVKVIRRGVEINHEPGPGLNGRVYRPAFPNVLANRDGHRHVLDRHHAGAAAGGEIAFLVEDAVVGKTMLGVGCDHLVVAQHRGGVIQLAVTRRWMTDNDIYPLRRAAQLFQTLFGRGDEVGPQ